MTSRERLLTTASFREPDRVPIELQISEKARELPECRRLVEFIDTEADNFIGVRAVDWGFFGLPCEQEEEIIEDRPGEFRRIRRVRKTAAGDFFAITKHSYPHLDDPDYHWERRFVHTISDLERLAEAPRPACSLYLDDYQRDVQRVGERGLPIVGLLHPLGLLVRWGTLEEVYGWFASEPQMMHRFLERTNAQICDTLRALGAAGIAGWFGITAHEMLIPPWVGRRQFDEFVFPYDKQVNDTLHQIGGRVRAHCHGYCMAFLERMAEMGIDAIEPLEPPPYGDVDLAEAKRRVGGRMVLSGNVPSQEFPRMGRDEVAESVRRAIAAAGPGGGFTLRTTGGHAGVNPFLDRSMLRKIIENVEAYIEAGLKYGRYPLRA